MDRKDRPTTKTFGVLLAALAVALAGCAGSDSPQAASGDDPAPPQGGDGAGPSEDDAGGTLAAQTMQDLQEYVALMVGLPQQIDETTAEAAEDVGQRLADAASGSRDELAEACSGAGAPPRCDEAVAIWGELVALGDATRECASEAAAGGAGDACDRWQTQNDEASDAIDTLGEIVLEWGLA